MKGIIIASFGSIYKEAVETSIGTIESKVRSLYRDVEVRRVFLSDALVEKWNENMMIRLLLSPTSCKNLVARELMRCIFNRLLS